MKLPRMTIFFINLSALLGGCLLVVFASPITIPMWKSLMEAVGTSLIATAGVTMFAQFLTERPKVIGIRQIADARNTVDPKIHDLKYTSDKIEAVGISLTGFTSELANNTRIAERVLKTSTRLRLIFVHPDARYLKQRADEDNMGSKAEETLRNNQRKSVTYCLQFFRVLDAMYKAEVHNKTLLNGKPKGIVHIRLIDYCPYVTIERYSENIYWGLYTSDTAGEFNPMFLTNIKENYLLYDKLKKHFDNMVKKDFKNDFLCDDYCLIKMESGEPWVNQPLAVDILGLETAKNLLGDSWKDENAG